MDHQGRRQEKQVPGCSQKLSCAYKALADRGFTYVKSAVSGDVDVCPREPCQPRKHPTNAGYKVRSGFFFYV